MSLLVLITGTGRSGTSTMAGSLHHLGLFVPGPYLGANESNPKGFYESRWAVRFHKQITAEAGIHEFDSRPGALARVRAVVTPERRAALVDFLGRQVEEAGPSGQVVVKDPRSVWVQDLWREAAAEAGLDIRYVSMLRHPAEVVGSRTTYYASQDDEAKRRRYEIFNVARWINNSLVNERETREQPRAFVPYADLLGDWRSVLDRVGSELGLTYDPPTDTRPHPVDGFVDPGLRRHQVTWDELTVPPQLRDIAQEAWDLQLPLAGSAAHQETVADGLDALAVRFERVLADAAAISHDAMEEATDEARRAGAATARAEGDAGRPPSGRLIEETSGRDLLRVVAVRARGKARRAAPGRAR